MASSTTTDGSGNDLIARTAAAPVMDSLDEWPEPDYSHLDLSFDEDVNNNNNNNNDNNEEEVIEFGVAASSSSMDTANEEEDRQDNNIKTDAPAAFCDEKIVGQNNKDITQEEGEEYNDEFDNDDEDYILGTLIVRVVAARDLTPVPEAGGGGGGVIGNLLSSVSSSAASSSNNRRKRGAHVNPYASVRFGRTTQRTSQEFRTTDPTWPRGESMFMDVTHPRRRSRRRAKRSRQQQQRYETTTATQTPRHPGDPPQKESAKIYKHEPRDNGTTTNNNNNDSESYVPRPPPPILTVAIFHSSSESNNRSNQRHNPSKKAANVSGDSDDVFLGMTAVDLTTLLTGKERSIDAWLPLQGGPSSSSSQRENNSQWSSGSVRVVCEYESSDAPPRAGDKVRFTGYCIASDLYPLHHHTLYQVVENDKSNDHNNTNQYYYNADQDEYVTISYTTPEGWFCSVVTHRFMLVCEERHHGALELYQEEIVSLGQRISRSPLVHTVQDQINKIPDEGLVSLGVSALQGAGSLWQRWMREGVQTAMQDVVHATNMDGQHDPSAEVSLATDDASEEFFEAAEREEEEDDDDDDRKPAAIENVTTVSGGGGGGVWEPLPNMPPCPITGEPMVDPVVAADGHTYERSAMARWLTTSDKSPLTGSVLPHKNLVPNYMLLSSLQDVNSTKAESTTLDGVDSGESENAQNNNNNNIENSSQTNMTTPKDEELRRVPSVPDDLEDQDL